jgi:hypothetical protein
LIAGKKKNDKTYHPKEMIRASDHFFHKKYLLRIEMQVSNIILPRFRVRFFYERKYEYSDSGLYTKEDLFPVHEIQEKPFYHDITNCHHHEIPGISGPLTQPFEETIGGIFPINKVTRHVD